MSLKTCRVCPFGISRKVFKDWIRDLFQNAFLVFVNWCVKYIFMLAYSLTVVFYQWSTSLYSTLKWWTLWLTVDLWKPWKKGNSWSDFLSVNLRCGWLVTRLNPSVTRKGPQFLSFRLVLRLLFAGDESRKTNEFYWLSKIMLGPET